MHPTKGKGPLLLRFLNELLRRLPKSNTEHVIFSGRILMFLSSVFPLGEKSGVNLRGNFNVAKETVFEPAEEKEDGMVVDEGRGFPFLSLLSSFSNVRLQQLKPRTFIRRSGPSNASSPTLPSSSLPARATSSRRSNTG